MNAPERDWLEMLLDRLVDVGISVSTPSWAENIDDGYDAYVRLSKNNSVQGYRVVYASSLTHTRLSRLRLDDEQTPVLAVGERITERSAASLRDLRIQFMDSVGNTYLEFGDVYIDIRGRRAKIRSAEHNTDVRPTSSYPLPVASRNLYSPRRSQVIFALMSWPHLAMARVQDVATAAGVSVGQAHETLTLLDEAGLLYRGTPLQAHQMTDLLEPWAAEYSRGLRRKLIKATFYSDNPEVVDALPGHDMYLSGESADGVEIYRPTTVTLYVDNFDRKLAFVNRWRNDPDRNPNVVVLRQFWSDPEDDRIAYRRQATGTYNAPWPLVYADLLAANDPRLAQLAAVWRDQHVRPGQV